MSSSEIEPGFAISFSKAETDDQLVIEDDGKTCYAYYLRAGSITGFVWLHNSVAAPEVPEWELPDAQDRLPYANPASHIQPGAVTTPEEDRFDALWGEDSAAVYVDGKLHAILRHDDQPGRCINALVDNSLAHRLILP